MTFRPSDSINSKRSSLYCLDTLVINTSFWFCDFSEPPSNAQSTFASSLLIGIYWSTWYFIVARSSASLIAGTSITVVKVLLDGKPIATFLVRIPDWPTAVIVASPSRRRASGESLAVILWSTGTYPYATRFQLPWPEAASCNTRTALVPMSSAKKSPIPFWIFIYLILCISKVKNASFLDNYFSDNTL